jgi:hypothetical protein
MAMVGATHLPPIDILSGNHPAPNGSWAAHLVPPRHTLRDVSGGARLCSPVIDRRAGEKRAPRRLKERQVFFILNLGVLGDLAVKWFLDGGEGGS